MTKCKYILDGVPALFKQHVGHQEDFLPLFFGNGKIDMEVGGFGFTLNEIPCSCKSRDSAAVDFNHCTVDLFYDDESFFKTQNKTTDHKIPPSNCRFKILLVY